MIKSTVKIARCCPLVVQGFSNFLGLFQVIIAKPRVGLGVGLGIGLGARKGVGLGVGMYRSRIRSTGSTINTLLHDKINPKDCQALSLGESRFL